MIPLAYLVMINTLEMVNLWTMLPIFLVAVSMSNAEFCFGMSQIFEAFGLVDMYSSWFSLMTMAVMMISVMATHKELGTWKSDQLFIIMWLMLAVMLEIFFTSNFLVFYIYFELSILPIFFLITGWGYQPERLAASYSMFFYTLVGSAPLIVILMFIFNLSMKNQFSELSESFSMGVSSTLSLVSICLFGGFLIKMPMYSVHLWLPKAHVEAPVFGSMILAGILLKLGSIGIIRLCYLEKSELITLLVMSISLFGLFYISMNCLKLMDLKQIIALSSVGHMAFGILTMFFFSKLSIKISFLTMITHAFSSSAMFYMVYVFYLNTHTRNILLNKGILETNKHLSLLWILIMMASMGTPPAVNAISEIMSIVILVSHIPSSMILLIMAFVASSAYSIILYSSTQQENASLDMNSKYPASNISLVILIFHVVLIMFSNLALNMFM
uniref:NADH-ubiquinone oxidoreductase chain 4 n=1 Tax=Paracyclopina nana TaxID=565004 RepID=C0J6S2_PARNA|nr:NADH dehydrogenase subunit 4 [Paracyclopina nana]